MAKAKAHKGEPIPARENPVAKVYVDTGLAHLDRTFDYLVTETQDADAVPGCRVKVRFAGQLLDGFLVARSADSSHDGKLAFLNRVVSAEPVLTPELLELARAVAERYGGTVSDVLRLAIPPRHARVERESPKPATETALSDVDTKPWRSYHRGEALLTALASGTQAKAVWQALPGEDWPRRLAEAAALVLRRGRGALVVVPDYRDLERLQAAMTDVVGVDAVVALQADLGPAERYRRWLRVARGQARVVVGTRASMFAPVADLGLLVVWDDGDDLHSDPRAPYPHVRDVLIQRAHLTGASLIVGGFARTAEAQLLVQSGWAHSVDGVRAELRERAPRVTGLGDDFELARDAAANAARLPASAFEAAREALQAGRPVLVQVPRSGYVPALACGQCREPARCRRCAGPLGLPTATDAAAAPSCRWCGAPEPRFRCPACGSARLRAVVVGTARTADELGRAFPGVPVLTSDARDVLSTVDKAALVVATPGAEPVANYGAALLLDGWALLGRPDLRAGEETLRRWMAAAALVDGDGRVIVGADAALPTTQALIRWDPIWHAERELADREELGFPPAMRMASVQGDPEAVAAVLDELDLPAEAEVLGPVELEPEAEGPVERALVRVPRSHGRALATAIAHAHAQRSARKDQRRIRFQLDPLDLI